jgi:Neutral/alkaline non-lysosomal ceramidase.
MNQLKVGVGREIITPKIGARLYGYALDVFGTSVNDELTATAIALQHNGQSAVLISATVCLINNNLSNEIRKKVSKKINVPAEHIVLSSTHTHSGPGTEGVTGWGEIDRTYCDEIFIPQLIKAAETAFGTLEEATLGTATIKSEIGINRRQLNRDNSICLGQNPWGSYDPNLTVLSFRNLAGKPIANLIHYGAHCTAAGKNKEMTRDWAGIMIDRLETESGAITAFFNGTEGDVGPRLTNGLTTGNINYVRELGGLAAQDAIKAYRLIKEFRSVPLHCTTDEIRLPYSEAIPLEIAEQNLKAMEAEKPEVNLRGRTYAYYKAVVEAYQRGLPKERYFKYTQTILKVGSVVFIPFPFEVFSEISLRLRHYSPYPHTLCLGCTNGNNGYLPTQDQICRGGYEISVFLTSGVQNLEPNTDYHIIAENLRIMEGLPCTE